MTEKKEMTYSGVGVNYDAMDPFKRIAQLAARATARMLTDHDADELEWSRGESAYLIEMRDGGLVLGHVEEGLGTKNLVADAMYALTGKSYYDSVAQCCVAMIVNDLITLGVLPQSIAMHLAVGSSDWFKDERRSRDLIEGWARACEMSGCAWGPGETPTLKDIVIPGTVTLSGSAVGIARKKEVIEPGRISNGDAIILFASSGIHANGLTLARRIAYDLSKDKKKLDGYLTKLDDGRLYGEALLDPTLIYAPFVRRCRSRSQQGAYLHYLINITGHGLRKLMRAKEPFAYIIDELPEPHPIFRFMQKHGPISDEEAYGNLNMGAGFAAIVSQNSVERVLGFARECGFQAIKAGHVETAERSRVEIRQKSLVYNAETLQVR